MTSLKLWPLAATLSLVLAACSSTPTAPQAAGDTTPVAANDAASKSATAATKDSGKNGATGQNADGALTAARSMYFDYDSFEVKPEFSKLLEAHGKYLAANAKTAIRVEGNTDERGGVEYNLALGQKRAEAVVKALKLYGANGAQLEAVSWGREKPKATGHDEASWAQNRRVDLSYPSK